ncbi:hypothetical protein ACNR9Q_15780 [Maribacter sp. X9]|uniref:hypothetical protein n=1 Tax=Maribacter sp. X9 TaxID=3402159 RepID=UPI003AF3CD29
MTKPVVFLLLVFFTIHIQAQNSSDAAKHIGAGIVIGGVGGYAAHKLFEGRRGWTWAGAVGSSVAAGLAKEGLYDKPRGAAWETKDVLYTTLGGVISGMALDVLLRDSRRRSGGGRGKNCGCLVVQFDDKENDVLPLYNQNGSGDIASALQASYLLN